MRKNWLLLLLATILVTIQFDANAQQRNKEKYRNKANDPVAKLPYYKKIRWADGLFNDGSYFNALDYYQQLKQEQERNPYLTSQLAQCYKLTRDYVPAAHYFGELYGEAPKLYPRAKFDEAQMLKQQGEYGSAISAFNQFIADNPKTYKKLKKTALIEIQGCNLGINSVKDPQPVSVINAGPNVNSAYTEFSPYPLGDTALLFSTQRQNQEVEVNKRRRDEYVARFMTSHKQYNVAQVDSFQWPLTFNDGGFNDREENTGNGCFSPGGERFYFTRCSEGDSNTVKCKIFVSKFEGEKWSRPEVLGEGINDDGSNTQPFCAKLGKKEVLFFSSNRKLQSRGGYDIWYSIIDPRNGTYRRPQNAGKQINTEYNEVTPYYDSRVNKLYFASDGWVSMGGFDIFSADGGPSRYSNLQNMGYPINTSADELYYIKDAYGSRQNAYVVSNRVGSIALKNPTCCDDIWRIQVEPKLIVIGKVLYRKTQQPTDQVVVKMLDQKGDLNTYNSTDGTFTFNLARGHSYVITGDKQGYTSTRQSVNTMDVKRSDPDDTVNVTIYLDVNESGFAVSNVYYDFDKATLRPESIPSLDSLTNFMKDNPSLTVEIYAFTDGKGTDEYNNDLSQRRAQSVLDFLEKKEIDKSRMIAKGFGKRMPAAPNTLHGKDDPEGRQLNRRTEFRIVSDVPTRRIIYNSAKPGSLDQQEKNLQINENMYDDDPKDEKEPKAGKAGRRTEQ
jgi:outer membrane protein OmpA-like peptidoglycan-associated protein